MVRIFARIAPGDVHLARGQVNHHRSDRFLPIQRVILVNGMVADRIREIDMILQNSLQTLDRMLLAAFEQSLRPEKPHAR